MQSQKRPAGGQSWAGPPPPANKRRGNGDEEEDFDALLMDEEEMMMADEEGAPEPFDEEMEGVMEGAGAVETLAKHWRRPDLPLLDPMKDDVDFQQLEADWEVGAPPFAVAAPARRSSFSSQPHQTTR
jgi:hypothetical protein